MRKVYAPFLMVLLSACGGNTGTDDLLHKLSGRQGSLDQPQAQLTKPDRDGGALSELYRLPELEALSSNYRSAEMRYDATKASQGFKLTGSGDFGARNQENSEGVFATSLTGQKSLNLQSENSLTLSILDDQLALIKLDLIAAIDRIFGKVMTFELSQTHLIEMREIADKYKSLYQQNRGALDAAISAGVISSSENFKFRKTLSGYDRKLHEAEAAHALLELDVNKYIDVLDKKFTDISRLSATELADIVMSQENFSQVEQLNKQASILASEKALLEGQRKPQGSLVSRLSSPASVEETWSAYVGLNIVLPIYDGGEKDLLIQEKNEQSAGVTASIAAEKQRHDDSKNQLKRYLSDAAVSLSMLAEEQKLSNEIIDDLKTRVGYGGASISDLVSEMMVLAELEFQVVDKQRQLRSQVIEYAINYGLVCSLTNSCDAVLRSVESLGR